MPELNQETINMILADLRNDAMKVQQMIDSGMMSERSRSSDYKDMDMLHYVVRTMESRVRILRGYQ